MLRVSGSGFKVQGSGFGFQVSGSEPLKNLFLRYALPACQQVRSIVFRAGWMRFAFYPLCFVCF